MILFRRFNLEAYDKNKHYVLVKELERDKEVQEFITHRFGRWIDNMPKNDDRVMIGCPYVIIKENKYVGILGTLDMSYDGIVDFWYAILKDERGKGYGDAILGEMTLNLVEEFKDVRLRIKKWNKVSKNKAFENGYVLEKTESLKDKENDIYYYFGKNFKRR